MTFLVALECSRPCGARPYNPNQPHHLCDKCGAPLFAKYDLEKLATMRDKQSLESRQPTLWRYREVLPIHTDQEPVTLGEGMTPLLRTPHLEELLKIRTILVKDESLSPTNSFKSRGLSVAVTKAKHLGAQCLSVPSAGNAANALAAYAARARLGAKVFLPKDAKPPFILECELYGADVTLVDGLITDAGREAAKLGADRSWYDISTLKEPYRVEGKKTLAYEVAEQLDWSWPDWFIYPTGGGTGIIGMWKAFSELESLGWVSGHRRPKMVSVQAEGCAPIVHAFNSGLDHAEPWNPATTTADGLRVPKAVGDFLILRAVRESGGLALTVSDNEMITGMRDIGRLEGISASPEGGATLAALRTLRHQGTISEHDSVVLFNTGGALKYLSLLEHDSKKIADNKL